LTNNPPSRKNRILVAVLNWGLGHASRSIPIIRALKKHNDVVLASTGRSLTLLRDEFPDCEALDFPDYNIKYSRNDSVFFLFLIIQIPKILFRLIIEHYRTKQLIKMYDIDIIISDNRYGVYSGKIPCYVMTHQLRFKLPKPVRCFEFISVWFNRLAFRKFQHVIVPDIDGNANLTGNLGHPRAFQDYSKLTYIGFLSSIDKQPTAEPIDVLFMISGPEPQRSVLEELILKQVRNIPGRRVVVLGKPGEKGLPIADRTLEIYPHLNRQKMSEYMNRARLIVARAGYSTIMEVIALGKPALFIPTPGQTEQEYIAMRLNQMGYFYCVDQEKLQLSSDLKIARERRVPENLAENINNMSEILEIMGLQN